MSRPYASEGPFRAVADPTRRRIIEILRKSEQSATDLARLLNVSGPTLSHHLSILLATSIVRQRRVGRQRVYQLQLSALRAVTAWCRSCEL